MTQRAEPSRYVIISGYHQVERYISLKLRIVARFYLFASPSADCSLSHSQYIDIQMLLRGRNCLHPSSALFLAFKEQPILSPVAA